MPLPSDIELVADGTAAETGGTTPIRPTIRGDDSSVTPVATETIEAKTSNDSKKHKTLCGKTQVEAIGEDQWKVTLTGFVVEEQLSTLIDMRPAENTVRVNTNFKTFTNVNFDDFRIEQTEDMNSFSGELPGGISVNQPLYRIELQTEEENPVSN